MKIKHLIAAAVAASGIATSMAQTATPGRADLLRELERIGQQEGPAYIPKSTLTRAEVRADVEIWNRSGLAQLDRRESPNVFSDQYIQAQARYQAMKASPQFAALVQSIAGDSARWAVGSTR